MLQNLRDKAQGWIAWIIIGLIALTFVLFGTQSMFSGTGEQHVLAKVQGVKITEHELDSAYRRFLHQPGNESITQLDSTVVKNELLQSLIDETIMRHAAERMGLRVSQGRIQLTLQSVPFFAQEGQFSKEAYHRYLMNADYTDSGFRALLSDIIVKQQLHQGLMQTSFSLDEDVATLIKFIMQKRDIRYLTVAREPFETNLDIKPEEIKQYFDSHQKDFLTDEQIALEYVVLSLNDLMKKHQPKESDVQAHEWAQEQLATLGDQLNDLSFDHPNSLQPAADKLDITILKTDLFSKAQGPKEPLLQNPIIMAAAFSTSVKEDKNNSEMLKLDKDNYIVLRVAKVVPAKQKPLEEVQADIIKTIKAEKSQQLALAKATQLYDAIVKDKQDVSIIKSLYNWQEQKDLTRSSTAVNAALIENAFSLPVPHSDVGEFSLVPMDNGDYAVLWLTKVIDGDYSALSQEEKDNFKAQLTKHYGELEFALYATDLVKQARVVRS